MKRIITAALLQESNTFSPRKSTRKDFFIFEDRQMLGKIPVTGLFEEQGYEVVPSLYAYSVPGGSLRRESFEWFERRILETAEKCNEIAGIWLYLHGALDVEEIGSGEARLLRRLRNLCGDSVPIAVALDFHANITAELVGSVNILCGYKTAPHTDEEETQLRAGRLLLQCIRDEFLPHPVLIGIPLLLPGEMVTTGIEPAKTIMKKVEHTEKKQEILCASFFCGMAWVDAPNSRAAIVVTPSGGWNDSAASAVALSEARKLAAFVWEKRRDFSFEEEAGKPEETLNRGLANGDYPVFISDTGDNVTAGAPGDSIFFLDLVLRRKCEAVLLAGITKPEIVELCGGIAAGESIELNIERGLDECAHRVPFSGVLKRKGKLKDIHGSRINAVVLSSGGADVIFTDERCSFTSPEVIESSGVLISDYKVIVVKLGYLFAALRKVSRRSFLALSPGSACLRCEWFRYDKVLRPVFPLDQDFQWNTDKADS
jgi:microcystin degradation protein MlrC